jgi:predicted DNA-binding transcriptional regulator YafY
MDIALLRAGEYVSAESFDMAQFSNIGVTINKGSIDYSRFQTQHDTLVKAIAEQRICSVSYNVGSGLKTRSIAPVNIVMLNGTIYVHGWVMLPERAEPKYDSPLKLSLHKITDVQLEPRHWKALPDIDKSSFGLLGTDNIKANVKFVDYAADYVASRKWSEDQTIEDCEDGIILTFTASSRVELISWVLSFGAQAELLAPVDIRAEIGRELAKAAGMYDL